MWWIGDNYAGNSRPRAEPAHEAVPDLHSQGIQWGGGSDYPVTPFAARYGLWASVARATLNGTYGAQPHSDRRKSVDIRHRAALVHDLGGADDVSRES